MIGAIKSRALPELALFGSDDLRAQALRAARRDWSGRSGLVRPRAFLHGWLIDVGIVSLPTFVSFLGLPMYIVQLSLLALLVALGAGALRVRVIARRRSLRRSLIEQGVPVCYACGYDMGGVTRAGNNCPDCGTPPPDPGVLYAHPLAEVFPVVRTFPDRHGVEEAVARLRARPTLLNPFVRFGLLASALALSILGTLALWTLASPMTWPWQVALAGISIVQMAVLTPACYGALYEHTARALAGLRGPET